MTIKITPIELGGNSKMFKFSVVLDAHSGNLDQDIVRIAYIVDTKGGMYQPNAWEGSVPGGHHREGVLVFNAISPVPEYIELRMKVAEDAPERVFKWNLK